MSARLVMVFRNQVQKERFVGGLLDGWGEGAPIDVVWADGGARKDGSSRVHAGEAGVFHVRCWEEDE